MSDECDKCGEYALECKCELQVFLRKKMSGECDNCGKQDLECKCKFPLDPDTIEGDYAEAYQIWTHRFNKDSKKVKECFKKTAFVPFEPFFDPDIQTPNWNALAKSLRKSQKEINER